MKKLRSLWLGELPLGEAFWTWAIGVGLVVNVMTTALFLAMIAADRPRAALFLGYALSVPYNILATIGVWRSANRYQGPAGRADLVRVATIMAMLFLTLT